MEDLLRANKWNVLRKVKVKAPAIKDRQNAVRREIKNAKGEINLYVNPQRCRYTDKGLSTVQLKKGSTFQEEDSDYQHITTAIGYFIDFERPIVQNTFSVSQRK